MENDFVLMFVFYLMFVGRGNWGASIRHVSHDLIAAMRWLLLLDRRVARIPVNDSILI